MDVKKWKDEMLFAFNRPEVINNKVMFIKNNLLHNIDFPAIIKYDNNINIAYYLEGKTYRERGPTYILYYKTGNIKEELYTNKKYRHHRKNGPAHIKYYENGNIKCEEYYKQDILLFVINPNQENI